MIAWKQNESILVLSSTSIQMYNILTFMIMIIIIINSSMVI